MLPHRIDVNLGPLANSISTHWARQLQQPPPIYIFNEVHGHGGDGGQATSDSQSQSSSETDADGWRYGPREILGHLFVGLIGLTVITWAVTHSRPQPGPMRQPTAPAQQSSVNGAIAL